ncbi:hypothetical protein STEG23_024165 [Scotinomys teguina]
MLILKDWISCGILIGRTGNNDSMGLLTFSCKENERQALKVWKKENYKGEGTLQKRRQKELGRQRRQRTPGEQGPPKQPSKAHMYSQRLEQQAQGPNRIFTPEVERCCRVGAVTGGEQWQVPDNPAILQIGVCRFHLNMKKIDVPEIQIKLCKHRLSID